MEANCLSRSKKFPPPPLCLPATNPIVDEQHIYNSQFQCQRNKSTTNCCLSSTTDECSHQSIPYLLPTNQRAQILETLIGNSSTLLTAPPSDGKHKRSTNGMCTNYFNLITQRQSAKNSMSDIEWIDFMRLIVRKSFEQDLKFLLDKYKITYFDRVNAPNTADDTIRSSLCHMVNEALSTYSSTSTTTDPSSPISTVNNIANGTSKRKRKTSSNSLSFSAPMPITNQTKFVISYLIPGKYENNHNEMKATVQQRQFQKKYSHLFKYIPENDDVHQYLKNNNAQLSSDHICLMLYDEVITHMDEYDLELSGISVDDCFTLPDSILMQIDGF